MLRISSRGRVRGPNKSVTLRLMSARARSDAGITANRPSSTSCTVLAPNSHERTRGSARMTAVSTAIVPR